MISLQEAGSFGTGFPFLVDVQDLDRREVCWKTSDFGGSIETKTVVFLHRFGFPKQFLCRTCFFVETRESGETPRQKGHLGLDFPCYADVRDLEGAEIFAGRTSDFGGSIAANTVVFVHRKPKYKKRTTETQWLSRTLPACSNVWRKMGEDKETTQNQKRQVCKTQELHQIIRLEFWRIHKAKRTKITIPIIEVASVIQGDCMVSCNVLTKCNCNPLARTCGEIRLQDFEAGFGISSLPRQSICPSAFPSKGARTCQKHISPAHIALWPLSLSHSSLSLCHWRPQPQKLLVDRSEPRPLVNEWTGKAFQCTPSSGRFMGALVGSPWRAEHKPLWESSWVHALVRPLGRANFAFACSVRHPQMSLHANIGIGFGHVTMGISMLNHNVLLRCPSMQETYMGTNMTLFTWALANGPTHACFYSATLIKHMLVFTLLRWLSTRQNQARSRSLFVHGSPAPSFSQSPHGSASSSNRLWMITHTHTLSVWSILKHVGQ